MRHALLIVVGMLGVVLGVTAEGERNRALSGNFTNWLENPAIQYRDVNTTDPVAQLKRKIESGEVQLRREGTSGYLRSVLDALHVPVESQIVIFNPDSVQARRINEGNPRSLFFNDRVAVGWVRGGFIEFAAQDPARGVIFYTLRQALLGPPTFQREDGCLACHYSYDTAGVAGMLVHSTGQRNVTHQLPIDHRWGGWYVTGDTGSGAHLGNIELKHIFDDALIPHATRWPSLEGKFDLDGYLTAHSDVAALMVFDHQMHMMNLLTRIGWEARVLDFRRGRAAEPPLPGDDPSEHPIALDDAAKEVVDYMLFVDEAPLRDAIRGSTSFAARFAEEGPRDHIGRSLRQLDLRTRLLTYPCSYMIYSEQFEQLPSAAKAAIYRRMWQVLSGSEKDPAYRRLTRESRTAIVEILHDTKHDVPDDFRAAAVR